jgi:transcriptional regulator with XRE-family HTH domain
MLACVDTPGGAAGTPSALRLTQRMDSLGLGNRELSRLSGLSRNTIQAAREGRARPATYGKLEMALDAFEHEVGADIPDPRDVRAVMELPDGTRVTFRGLSAEDVARAVAVYLQESANEG